MPSFSLRRANLVFVAGALLISAPSFAQGTTPRLVSTTDDTVKLGLSERVTLPFSNVSRIIVEDDQIASASFLNGAAILQGLSAGSTIVEVYQTDGTPKVLTVNVEATAFVPPSTTPTVIPTSPPAIVPVLPPVEPVTQPDPIISTPLQPARSQLSLAMAAKPVSGFPSQAQFNLTYGNPGVNPAEDVVVRFTLDDRVSYVTGSASKGGVYDPSRREVVWDLGILSAGLTNQPLSLRVEPVERQNIKFDSTATIEQGNLGAVASAKVSYSTNTTPLLTVFALPDRFLAGRNGSLLIDVRGSEFQSAVDRLAQMGVVSGRTPGYFYPKQATKRAEYAVMTLNGLNLRDLRDITQIKFVLSRRSTVNLTVQDDKGRTVFNLIRNTTMVPGEHTAIWNGRTAQGFAPAGRYTYVCTARDEKGETTTLRGYLTIVPPTGLKAGGQPSFVDVKSTDWYARYLALGEKQGLIFGFPDKTFRPQKSISRLEATAIVVRALGLEDTAKQWANKDVGFSDYDNIPSWGRGYVNVASTIAKTAAGRPIIRGTAENRFEPDLELRRDQAALVVQRLIDRETTRRVSVSGAIVPGALVSINSKNIEADDQGKFSFSFDLNTSTPTTVAVVDTRDR